MLGEPSSPGLVQIQSETRPPESCIYQDLFDPSLTRLRSCIHGQDGIQGHVSTAGPLRPTTGT